MTKTTYYNARTKETTTSAARALGWHNGGDNIEIWKKGETRSINGAKVETERERFDRVEGRERCKAIAKELNNYAGGYVHKCPECDEVIDFPDNVGDKFKCPYCGHIDDAEEFEELTIYDYFNDFLDIDYTVNRYKEYQSASICIGYGGPNIYIDTASAEVQLFWGSTRECYPIYYSTRDQIDEWAEELYNY